MKIFLRKINKNDINYFYKIKTDSNVCKYLKNNNIENINEIETWFNFIFYELNTDRFIILNFDNFNYNDENIIGDICIGDINYIDLTASLHIKILPEYWGKGIGSIVIDKIILYCKNLLGLKKLFVSINKNNLRSLNLFSKFKIIQINEDNEWNHYNIIL